MRLIDVDRLKEDCRMADDCKSCPRESRACNSEMMSRMEVCEMIDDAETVLSDGIVICDDCVHYGKDCEVEKVWHPNYNWFCADGYDKKTDRCNLNILRGLNRGMTHGKG